MITRILTFCLAVAFSTGAVLGHEFWIDPLEFRVETGEPIQAEIRVGQVYQGSGYSYLPRNFRRFEIVAGDETIAVEGTIGDRPALNQPAPEGLAVIVHETRDYTLTYREYAKFEAFVREKDAAWTLEAHAERGLPQEGFDEVYSRYAKALVAVGAGAGRDRVVGMETELIAGLNPYTDDVSGGLPVTLTYKGAPRPDAQITVFEKAPDGTVAQSTVRTGADGQALIPVRAGMRYMLDAVVLREPEPAVAAETGAVWESLWANLSFAVP